MILDSCSDMEASFTVCWMWTTGTFLSAVAKITTAILENAYHIVLHVIGKVLLTKVKR